jgi:hypothetical protein
LESNWRSGNCADSAVELQIENRFGATTASDRRFLSSTILDYLHGRSDLATLVSSINGRIAYNAAIAAQRDVFTGGGGTNGGAGASGSWTRDFAALRDHWARHGEALGTRTPDQYLIQADRNVDRGRNFAFRIDGSQRMAHITRMGSNAFMFTSTNLAETRIFTHMKVSQQYLSNVGITLPKGF